MSSQYFSLVTDAEGEDGDLGSLFSKSVVKDDPVYDYSTVDGGKQSRKNTAGDEADQADIDEDPNEPMDSEEEEKAEAQKAKAVKLKTDKMAQVKHEDTKKRIIDEEKEGRTVFVGNLSVNTKKLTLKKLFGKFGKVETVRFRCAGRPDMKTTKKVAVIKQTFHDNRDNICAYVRMSSVSEAEAACSLNGSSVEGFTIRVDMALKGKVHDNKKSIFLGNLSFSTKEEDVRQMFSKCGTIENIRIVRDGSTGIGKGFGYVNFDSEQSVAKALRLNGQEVSGRKVRVSKSLRKPKSAATHKSEKKLKNKQNRNMNVKSENRKDKFKRSGSQGRKTKSYQGLNTSKDKKFKKKNTKIDKRNKTMAKILSN